MMIIFATMRVDPASRDQIAEKMNQRLEQVAPTRNGAAIFELLLSATDPSRIHVFQTWESQEAFVEWGAVESHRAAQAEFGQWMNEVSSVQFTRCTPLER